MTAACCKFNASLLTKRATPWVVVLVAALFFFYEFIQMNMFNVLSSTFEQHFQLSAFAIGAVSAFYFLSDSILLYPVGILLDKFSSRGLILIGMLMCIIGTFLMSIASNSLFLVIARLLAGTAAAFCLLSILRLAAQWFSPSEMGKISGIVITIGMLGGAISQTPLALLIMHLGWRYALLCVALLGVCIWVLMFFIVNDAPSEHNFSPVARQGESSSIALWPAFLMIVKNRLNWLVAFYICMMNLPIMLLAGLFGEQYLIGSRGFSAQNAATISMMIFIGFIVGSTFFGYLTDAIKRRKVLMVYSAIFSLLLFCVILYWPVLHVGQALLLFFLLGLLTAAQIIGYPVTRESNPSMIVGQALGFISVIIMGLPGLLQPLVGYIMDAGGHLHHFAATDYKRGLSIMVVGFVTSIICGLLLPETYGNNKESEHG